MTDGGMHYLYGSINESRAFLMPICAIARASLRRVPLFRGLRSTSTAVMILKESFRGDEGVSLDDLAGSTWSMRLWSGSAGIVARRPRRRCCCASRIST